MNNDFLKVMIVDDEPLVRDLLEKCVNWGDLGIEIVGKAASAFQAIDLLDKLTPDIVFTDICMPSMDGIELAEKVLEKYPRTKVVIITGYEDFEYAQRSIKAGVKDFILKPINDEEITKVTLKIKSVIEMEKEHFDEYQLMKEQLKENSPYLKEKFFNELLLNDFEAAEIETRLQYCNIPDIGTSFQVAVMEVHDNQNLNPEERLAFKIRCYDLIRKHLEKESLVTVFLDNRQRMVILNHSEKLELSACCEEVRTFLVQQLPCSVCIGEGQRHQGLGNIRLSYQEACEAFQLNFFRNNKTSKIIQDVQHYLNEHYHNQELSLVNVAKVFYLNPSYLSRIFRQEVHRTFVDYLTEIRMENAIRLIKTTDLKAYQVAEAVGINDPHYFGICFKKYTGLSFCDYRRN
jgi:two-component system response regulator YesN